MQPVKQTKEGIDGNCLAAVIASILELELGDVPDFGEDRWITELFTFLAPYGIYPIFVSFQAMHLIQYSGYYGVSGKSPRGLEHIVVYKDGLMVHDPYELGGGVIPKEVLLFGKVM